ncbi:MAG: twin-arginine translocation signal domain-containing protein [Opitutales bacterium]|nr:twin-arginine translocation signal domain-containing protein [Opitutales bacterium]
MENFSRRNFLKKLAAASAAAAFANPAFALKRRPIDTRETMSRARGNVAGGLQICDAFGSAKSAAAFSFSVVGDVSGGAAGAEEVIAKNAGLAAFCKNSQNAKFCAEIPLDKKYQKYLGEILQNPKCAAVCARIAKGADVSGGEFLQVLEKSALCGKPVYIFARQGGGKFAREIADLEIARAVLEILENDLFKKFAGLKIVLPNCGIAAISSLAASGKAREFSDGIFYLVDCGIEREVFEFAKSYANISQFLFASGGDAEGSLARLEALPLSSEQFKKAAFKNCQSLFAVEK